MANSNWITGSGTWTAASSWSAGVPGPGDTAVFDTGSTSPYVVQGPGTAGTLTVNDYSVDFAGAITDVVDLVTTVGTATSSSVTLSGPGASWTSNGGLLLGIRTHLDISDRATLAVGANGLTISSRATLALDPTVSLSGPLVLLDGTLIVQNGTTGVKDAPLTLSNPVLLAGEGTVTTRETNEPQKFYVGTLTLSGSVTGTGGLTLGSIQYTDHNTIEPLTGNTVVLSGRANSYSGGTSLESGTLVLAAAGAGGSGPMAVDLGTLVVAAGATAPVISDLSAGSVINVDAGLSVFETSGSTLTFLNGAGRSTVVSGNSDGYALAGRGTIYGGTGSVTVFGGRNLVFGGSAGGNLLVSTIIDTLVGGGGGDLLVGDGGNDLLVAGAGNETLTSAGESDFGTGAMIYGGAGADVIAAGSLYDTVVAGSGAATIFGGAADPNILYAGSGADVIVTGGRGDFVQAGAGNSSIFAAQGANLVTFVNGGAGGSDVISGFKVGTDTLALRGYTGSGVQAGLAGTQVTGGSTVLTLTDGTRVTLLGVASLGGASFV